MALWTPDQFGKSQPDYGTYNIDWQDDSGRNWTTQCGRIVRAENKAIDPDYDDYIAEISSCMASGLSPSEVFVGCDRRKRGYLCLTI